MHHEIALISTIAIGLLYALIGGYLASRLRLPPLVGYLVAGVALGPFTPGFVGAWTTMKGGRCCVARMGRGSQFLQRNNSLAWIHSAIVWEGTVVPLR